MKVVRLPAMAGGWAPVEATCPHCEARIALLSHEHVSGAKPGERVYLCDHCGRATAFYSAAWLS
jgi:uncharacterized protein with PIN domain